MDLEDKITAPLGLATLDESGQEGQSPEQYAINTIGGRALQTANTLIKKSEQAIENALAEPAMPDSVTVMDWPARKWEQETPSPYGFSSPDSPQAPPAQVEGSPVQDANISEHLQVSPGRPTSRAPKNAQPQYAQKQEKKRTAPSPAKESVHGEADTLQTYEKPALATYQNEQAAFVLQNQGPGLALAEESGAGLQTFQAAGQAAEGSTSAASVSAGPAAIAYQITEKAVSKIKDTVDITPPPKDRKEADGGKNE